MRRLVVAAAARQDLRDIARFTEETWGLAQSRRYMSAIRERFIRIRDRPAIGAPRDDVRAGYRSLPSGRHVIFYRLTDEAVEIVRVLHDSMDVHRHVGP